MKEILEKYYGIKEDNRKKLKDLYIFHVLQEKIKEHEDLEFNIGDEESLFYITKDLIENSNIRASVIIDRLLDILECQDIELYELEDLDVDELIELVSNEKNDFKKCNESQEILTEFDYKNCNCVFVKDKDKFMIICQNPNDPESNVIIYNSFEQLLCSIIDIKLK